MTYLNARGFSVKNSYIQDTVAIQGVSSSFDRKVAALSPECATKVQLPSSAKGRSEFLRNLAARSAARLAAGSTALILVLLSANGAAAQSETIELSSIKGVASAELQADGSLVVTMENGSVVRLPEGSFTSAGGDFVLSGATAAQITEAAAVATGGGVGLGAAAAVGGVGAAAAGGGGGSSDGSAAGTPLSGEVVDGYIVNATVFQDVNGNQVFDSGEPNTTTDATGGFNIELDPNNPDAKLISFGGIDSSTGQSFTGTLTAPAGSSVITPLTSLVQSLVEKSAADGTPISVADANAQLASALGLDGQDLLTLDPVEVVADGGSADAYAAAAQVASVISAAAAAQGGDEGDSAAASEDVAAALAEQLLQATEDGNSNPEDILNDSAVIQQALEDAGVEAGEAEDVAGQVEAANTLIDDAAENGGTPEEIQSAIASVQEVVQGNLVDEISDPDGDVTTIDVETAVDELVALRPVVTTVASGTFGTNELDQGFSVGGTGRPGSQVKVSVDGVERITTVDMGGDWAVSLSDDALPSESGQYEVEAAGGVNGSNVFTSPVSAGQITVDLTPPEIPVLNPVAVNDGIELEERDDILELSGNAEAGATVSITIGTFTETVTAAPDGTFTLQVDPSVVDLPTEDFVIGLQATDALGNASASGSHAVTVEPETTLIPTVDPVSGTFGPTSLANGLNVTGTGREGSTVTVTIDGMSEEAEVGQDGNWSVDFTEAELPDATGSYSVSASAVLPGTDFVSGPVSGGTLTVDLDAAPAPTLDQVTGDDFLDLEEQSNDVDITGSAEANATVRVTFGDAETTVTANSSGDFVATFGTEDIPAEDFVVTATATDALGNTSTATTREVGIKPEGMVVNGTTGDDVLNGTAGDDVIDPMGNADGYDEITGSAGDDTIVLSNSGGESYVELNYNGLTGPITATVDYEANSGSVSKGADGTDTLIDPDVVGPWGLGFVGTDADDAFNITSTSTTEGSWTGIFNSGGIDTVNVDTDGNGIVRLGTSGEDVTADLNTGDVSFGTDGFDLNLQGDGNVRIELQTRGGDDNVTGSDRDERFILGTGSDTLDAGGGYDLIRYDRGGVSEGVTVDLAAGTATGTWDGQAFSHTLSNVEEVRGSQHGDDLTANDSGSRLDGRDGNDTLTGGAGEDVFVVGKGHDVIFDFDFEMDEIADKTGTLDGSGIILQDTIHSGQDAVSIALNGTSSVTLVGYTADSLSSLILSEELGQAPALMNDPLVVAVNGDVESASIMIEVIGEGSYTPVSSSEITWDHTVLGVDYSVTLTGSNLGIPQEGVYTGTVDTVTLSGPSGDITTMTNVDASLADFASVLDASGGDGVLDADLAIGDRDLIVVGDDAAQVFQIDGVDQWIDAGGGDDHITIADAGIATVISGDGSDQIQIEAGTGSVGQTFIYIDPNDTGVDQISGFRFTDSSETGDIMVVAGPGQDFSMVAHVDDVTDAGELAAIASNWTETGEGEYALFYDDTGAAVLKEIVGSNGLGDDLAVFANSDFTGFTGNHIDSFLNINEAAEIPVGAELV